MARVGPFLLAGRAAPWLAPWALLVLTGCSSREATYPVAGVVRFEDGAPAPFGAVEFRHRHSGRIARGQIDAQGRFTLGTFVAGDGAPAGPYQVIVIQSVRPDRTLVVPSDDPTEGSDPVDHDHRAPPKLAAPRYADYATSPLEAVVAAAADNHVELVVAPAPRRRP